MLLCQRETVTPNGFIFIYSCVRWTSACVCMHKRKEKICWLTVRLFLYRYSFISIHRMWFFLYAFELNWNDAHVSVRASMRVSVCVCIYNVACNRFGCRCCCYLSYSMDVNSVSSHVAAIRIHTRIYFIQIHRDTVDCSLALTIHLLNVVYFYVTQTLCVFVGFGLYQCVCVSRTDEYIHTRAHTPSVGYACSGEK